MIYNRYEMRLAIESKIFDPLLLLRKSRSRFRNSESSFIAYFREYIVNNNSCWFKTVCSSFPSINTAVINKPIFFRPVLKRKKEGRGTIKKDQREERDEGKGRHRGVTVSNENKNGMTLIEPKLDRPSTSIGPSPFRSRLADKLKSIGDFSSLHNFVISRVYAAPSPLRRPFQFRRPRLMSSIVIEKRQCSWLQKQAWLWIAKFAEISRFYWKAVVLISEPHPTPPPLPPDRPKIADDAKRGEGDGSFAWYSGNWRVFRPPQPPSAPGYRPFQFRS